MAARRRKQSNAMLYTLITFVGLFIATTTVAVIYYVKAEEYKTDRNDLEQRINELATDSQRGALGSIVGARQGRETYLGLLTDYVDQTATMIMGGVPAPDESAEIKVNNAEKAVKDALNLASEPDQITITDPNIIGLIQTIKDLVAALKATTKAKLDIQQELAEKQKEFANALQLNAEAFETLQAEKDKLQQQFSETKEDYDELRALLQQTTSEQVQTLRTQLDQTQQELTATNDALLKTEAELKDAREKMRLALAELAKIEPGPDRAVLAREPDGQVILIDDKSNVVHLNIGSNEHVYPGLTFKVYDRGAAVPSDPNKGKAEIQVFDVAETYSAARILNPDDSEPILKGDIVANLIWDADRTNEFVAAGEFDLDRDGQIEPDALARIQSLVEKWGGRMADTITIDTDFLVLGKQPSVLEAPTLEEREIDPRAQQRYQESMQRLARYNQLREKAQNLWIPVFTYEKFLHFIGYDTQVTQAGAI
jgi:hypothetical protein